MGAIHRRLDCAGPGALLVPVFITEFEHVPGTRTNGLRSCAIMRTVVVHILIIERVIRYFDAHFWLHLRTAFRVIATTHLDDDACEISQKEYRGGSQNTWKHIFNFLKGT